MGTTRMRAVQDLTDGLTDLFEYLQDIGERVPAPRRLAVDTVRA